MSNSAASVVPEDHALRAVTRLAESRVGVWTAWAVWAAMSLACLWFVWSHALVVPFADEWHWVSVAGGAVPITPQWLCSQHNEHRPLLPRLAYLGLARLTNYDFRAGGMLNAAMLSALAAVMMFSARAIRGRGSLCDAFYPLVLLHWAQFTNLLWGFQICLVMAAVFIGAGMLAIAHAGRGRWLAWAAVAVACFVAATLSAGAGLAYLPGLALWLLAVAVIRWRQGGQRRVGELVGTALLGLAIVVVAAAYLVGFHQPSQHAPPGGILPAMRTGAEFLANAFGAVGKKLWPVSAIGMAAGCLISLAHLLRRAWLRPAERVQALGLLSVLVGCAGVTAAIGWSRAFLGPGSGFEERYVTLAIPLACLFYLQSVVLPGRWSTRIQIGLVLLAGLVLVPNAIKGLRGAASLQAATGRLLDDARAGVPLDALAVRYLEGTGFDAPANLARQLNVLWQNGWGPYRHAARRPTRTDLRVRPLAEPAAGGTPLRIAPLGPGDSLACAIQGSGDVKLEQIDLLAARRPRRAPDRLRWELDRPGGGVLASGVIDVDELAHTDWLTIRPAPVIVHGDWRLELRLTAEGPAGARPLEIPLFAPGESLKGFLYLSRQ